MVLSELFAQVLMAMMSQVCLTQQKTFHFPIMATGLQIGLLEIVQVHAIILKYGEQAHTAMLKMVLPFTFVSLVQMAHNLK